MPSNHSVLVRLRNTGSIIPAKISISKDELKINPEEHVEGVSPGQAAVIYDRHKPSKVLGGGWIVSTKSNLITKYSVSSSVA